MVFRVMALALVLSFLFAGQARADVGGGQHQVQEIEGYKVRLSYGGKDPQVGHNVVTVRLAADGKSVSGAKVMVLAELYPDTPKDTGHGGHMGGGGAPDPSPAKPKYSIRTELKAGQEDGEYAGDIELAEAGHWMMTVTFLNENRELSCTFVEQVAAGQGAHTSAGGRNLLLLWLFLGANAGIVAVAAVTRRKAPAAGVQEKVL